MKQAIHGIILAGGKSSRMGTDKAVLPIAGKPLIRHIADNLAEVCTTLTLVVSNVSNNPYYTHFGNTIRYAEDTYPGSGPLAGIHAGLVSIPSGFGFVMACDMPYFSMDLFQTMLESLHEDVDAILCKKQPFHALYHTRIAAKAETCLRQNQLKLNAFIESLHTVYVPTMDEKCFVNLNSPAEYEDYLRQNIK
jgi:molybdopterin-guanine dinucleotide biosynthesis protein A